MTAQRFVDQLNVQIGKEFAAHQQYVACAIHYDSLTMPRMASFFYEQALEERDHAMMMVQYLLDQGAQVQMPGVDAPVAKFGDLVEPVQLAVDQEKTTAEQINELTRIARDEGDLASEHFMQWFIAEQVEEIATMSALLAVVTRAKDDIEAIEEYVARELNGGSSDAPSGAPRIAGA